MYHLRTMVVAIILLTLLPCLVTCYGEGNIHLLENEVAVALKACDYHTTNEKATNKQRQSRSVDTYDTSPRIDDGMKQMNTYGHERRNSTEQTLAPNATEYDDGDTYLGEDLSSVPQPTLENEGNANRTRRNEPLFNHPDTDQCLSQCVFANLQVVDSRGIPHEAELWNKVQASVTSQQSRAALRDQIRACFQELQSEAEDNGCSYSNKLERCLMLRFSDRKATPNQQNPDQGKQKTDA